MNARVFYISVLTGGVLGPRGVGDSIILITTLMVLLVGVLWGYFRQREIDWPVSPVPELSDSSGNGPDDQMRTAA